MAQASKERMPASAPQHTRISSAWRPFTHGLAKVLARLKEDQFLVISSKRSNRFVQFAGQGSFGLRAETVGNNFLATDEKLSEAQVAGLQALGWLSPTGSAAEATPEKDPDGSPNFHVDADPSSAPALAELAMKTFVAVHGIPHPGFLQYSSFDADNNSLAWPELGIKRAKDETDRREVASNLLAAIREITNIHDLDFDEDGDVCLRYGSVAAAVDIVGDPPCIRIRSAVLRDVETTPALLERLNELNLSTARPHFVAGEDAVHAVSVLSASPFVVEHLSQSFHDFFAIADGMDELLQAEFGGRIAFDTDMPSTARH